MQFRKNRSVHAFKRHPGRRFADLYEGNGHYSAAAYAAGGAPFLVHKATEGIGHIDSLHATRCEATHGVGLAVGHYHFYHEDGKPELQARHFWSVVRPHFLERWPSGRGHDDHRLSHTDFLIVDVESQSGRVTNGELANFCRELHRLSGGKTLIGYSNKAYLLERDLHIPGDKWWVADYPTFPGKIGGRILWAHQFTEHGSIPGCTPPTDCSVLVARKSIRFWENQ